MTMLRRSRGGVFSSQFSHTQSRRLGDNCHSMNRPNHGRGAQPPEPRISPYGHLSRARRNCSLLGVVVLLCAGSAWSWQGGSSKPAANPLSSLLKEKPKVPVVSPELPPAIPEQPVAIPLPDVAARSLDLGQKLRDAASQLPTREQFEAIQSAVAELEPSLTTKQDEVNTLLSGSPNSLQVREEENFWRGMQGFTSGWQQQLLTWANSAQDTLAMLEAQEPAWTATLEENKGNRELAPVLLVVEGNLADMRRLRKQAQEALQSAVNLQIKVGNLDATANEVTARLVKAQSQLKGHLLDRDSLPLWRVGERRQIGENAAVFRSVHSRWISILSFFKEKAGAIVFLAVLFLASLLFMRRLHQLTRDKQPADDLEADAYRMLKHWFAVGLLAPMVLGYVLAPSAPLTVLGLVILVSFFPILIILPPLLNRRFRLVLYFFAATFGLMWLVSWIGLDPATRRELEFLIRSLLFLVLAYLARPAIDRSKEDSGWRRFLLLAVRALVLFLGISLAADLFGYMKLAHYLALACIYSTILGISVFTAWRVLTLLLTVGLRSPAAERIALVRLHRDGIVRWLPRGLTGLGVFIWVTGTLDLLGIADPVLDRLGRLMDFHIAGGGSGATIGGVLGFFVILAVGYAIARAIRFLFLEEIFRRFHMARGLPELLASIMYYLLLLMVALAAVNAGGIELNKFTVLTGAFGVGVGFGLQNIINNFVSGLILQFERPIHIDDIIEVDTNTGKVTRIGIRSSTIQTFQGAEVIVPNASLISSKVINWTLSESQRRRELPVGVAYGSDPNKVLQILRDAAARHELVLSKPEPMAYFKGFGESSLNFELHFWVMQENNGLLITSDVALAAMRALTEAGIEIPFPQRDLNLRSIDPAAAALLPSRDKS